MLRQGSAGDRIPPSTPLGSCQGVRQVTERHVLARATIPARHRVASSEDASLPKQIGVCGIDARAEGGCTFCRVGARSHAPEFDGNGMSPAASGTFAFTGTSITVRRRPAYTGVYWCQADACRSRQAGVIA